MKKLLKYIFWGFLFQKTYGIDLGVRLSNSLVSQRRAIASEKTKGEEPHFISVSTVDLFNSYNLSFDLMFCVISDFYLGGSLGLDLQLPFGYFIESQLYVDENGKRKIISTKSEEAIDMFNSSVFYFTAPVMIAIKYDILRPMQRMKIFLKSALGLHFSFPLQDKEDQDMENLLNYLFELSAGLNFYKMQAEFGYRLNAFGKSLFEEEEEMLSSYQNHSFFFIIGLSFFS